MPGCQKTGRKVALCTDTLDFQRNRIFDQDWAKRFPGALSAPLFAKRLITDGCSVVTGDVAVGNVRTGYWDAKDVIVIQELNAVHGRWLTEHGATPCALLGYESPGYVPDFYDQLGSIAPTFRHRILFSGAFDFYDAPRGFDHPAHFPSFDSRDIQPAHPWNERGFLVMVAGNKSYLKPSTRPVYRNPFNYLRWVRSEFADRASPTRRLAVENELQSDRLEAIEYFGQYGFSLFGQNWDDLTRLTTEWRKRLVPILGKISPQPCDNKTVTIAWYKFSICFENMCFPGYITEKIIDCFVAGTIPIYLGAPDIAEWVPRDAFVDRRDFDSWDSLHSYLDEMSEADALRMITAGRDFLNSPQGNRFSYRACAEQLYDFVVGCS